MYVDICWEQCALPRPGRKGLWWRWLTLSPVVQPAVAFAFPVLSCQKANCTATLALLFNYGSLMSVFTAYVRICLCDSFICSLYICVCVDVQVTICVWKADVFQFVKQEQVKGCRIVHSLQLNSFYSIDLWLELHNSICGHCVTIQSVHLLQSQGMFSTYN